MLYIEWYVFKDADHEYEVNFSIQLLRAPLHPSTLGQILEKWWKVVWHMQLYVFDDAEHEFELIFVI